MRFVTRELLPGRFAGDYMMGKWSVVLEHGTPDIWTFKDIFIDRFYEIPVEIPPPRLIADLGGNVGLFTLFAAMAWPDAEIVAFEPDPANARRYRETVQRNAINARLIEACASSANGSVRFAEGLADGSHIVEDDSGIVVDAVDVFPQIESADVIKIDIEGGEWALLMDHRFASLSASVMLLEYHPRLCPEADAQEASSRVLRDAGFELDLVHQDRKRNMGVWRAIRATNG